MEYKQIGQVKYPQNLSPEKQAIIDEMARNYANELRGINTDNLKNQGRIWGGSILSGLSFHPILNIPYVGTGIGGAMYDLGQGIAEGEKLPELAKRTGRGFVIGETVGAVPYVGKIASKTKTGQAVGKALDEAGEKFAQTKAYDALMSEFAPGREVYKNTVLPYQRKISAGINPLEKAYNEVLYDADDFIDLTKAFNDSNLNLQNSLQDAKNFINEANANEIAFETGSPDFFFDMIGNSKQKGHILRSNKVRQMSDADKLNHNVIISNFDEVSKGLKPISEKPSLNKKINKKPNVEEYYYFEGNVKNGDNIIPIIADAEKNFGEPLTTPQKLHLYNVYDKKFSPILNDKTPVILGENSNNIIANNNIKSNPLNNVYNDFIQNLNNSANINNMKKELPEYIKKEIEKSSQWGSVRSSLTENNKQGQMLRDLYNFEMEGKPLSINDLKNRYPTRADEEIKKVYDIYLNKNYEITKPYEASKKVIEEVYNKDYRPLYKQSSNDKIIEFYNSQSSTDKVGHGYNNYSMSNNAVEAYKRGNMPASKWNKTNIINKIKDISKEFDIPINEEVLNKTSLKDLKSQYLKKNGYHHTSKMYNTTDFYNIDIAKLLEQADKM